MNSTAYLDFNATAPTRPEVIEAVADAMRSGGNASSVHGPGRAARARVEQARRRVAALVGAEPSGVIFTGSGTEANNQALRRTGRARLLVGAIEHESVIQARDDAELIPVGADGRVDLAALERLLDGDGGPALVSVMAANNETGIVQPVAEVARLAHARGALVHCDAVQAAGKLPVDMAALGVDFLSLSAHKIGGPQGVGALVCRDPARLGRLVHGGGQEAGLRAGTENVPGIVGFGVAADSALRGLDGFAALADLRDGLEARMRAEANDIVVIGGDVARLPNTAKVATPGLAAEVQVMGLDLAGVAISAGSACSAGRVEIPYVLNAMGVAEEIAYCAVRVSLGWTTTADDLDAFFGAWSGLRRRGAGPAAAH
ncbi:MAG: cysteine desulfurase family protein [Alphaproteobacteria bacterium]